MVAHVSARNASSTAIELRGYLRYYRPAGIKGVRCPDPPHVYFANLRIDQKSLFGFEKNFGPLLEDHLCLTPEAAALAEKRGLTAAEGDRWRAMKPKWEIRLCDLKEVQLACDMQQLLRKGWRGDSLAVSILQHGSHPEDPAQQGPGGRPRLKAVPSAHGVDIEADDLWSYIRIAFCLDHASGKARVCPNPECGAPHFIARRKDSKLCGQEECTAWKQRQWSLDWWNERGDKVRRAKAHINGKDKQ